MKAAVTGLLMLGWATWLMYAVFMSIVAEATSTSVLLASEWVLTGGILMLFTGIYMAISDCFDD
jgi:hypothetical protein